MMEVQSAAGGGPDLLMECDEEEQEVWPQAPERDDEVLVAAVQPMKEDTDLPPVRMIPIPVLPVSSCSPPTHLNTVKSSGALLGFKVNGRLIRLLPGGGAAELKLCSHPGGSASGFNTVQIHSPAINTPISRTATFTAAAATDPTLVIAGVVSGEAAQKVLRVHSVNFKSIPAPTGLKPPSSSPTPPGASPVTLSSPMALTSPWTFTLTSPWTLISPQNKPHTTPAVSQATPVAWHATPLASHATPQTASLAPQAIPLASQATLETAPLASPVQATPLAAHAIPQTLLLTSLATLQTAPLASQATSLASQATFQTTPLASLATSLASQATSLASQATFQTTPLASQATSVASQATPQTALLTFKTIPLAFQTTPLASQSRPPAPKTTHPASTTIKLPTTTTTTSSSSSSSGVRPAAPYKPLHKGQLGPISPPHCVSCSRQYKLIKELRGFMCLCSPAIAASLKDLKRKHKNFRRRIKDRKRKRSKDLQTSRDLQTIHKVSKTRPGPCAIKGISPLQRTCRLTEDFLSEQLSPPCPPCSPQMDSSEPPPEPLHGKLVILVEDFYYGSDPGPRPAKPDKPDPKFSGPFRCIHCPKSLRNNLKLMSHMKQHVSTMSLEDGDFTDTQCPHCFRHFLSPFKLQCHVEAVHSQLRSTAKCQICELEFGSEAAFLWHMKSSHKPGEMPYICQVCGFRSSFYSDVWSHFHKVHANTRNLMCQYCLRVMRSNTCYQQHFTRHQKKHVFSCERCRLHFLYVRERIEHKLSHRTHIRPPQLIGLKPGTKVTVRTFSVVGEHEEEAELKKTVTPCKVVNAESLPRRATKRKPVRRLGPLLSTISQRVSRPSQRCVECLSSIQAFESHFPSLVHCSLCRFITCCSTSYANHMINNHATCRKKPPYLTIFQSDSRSSQRLMCVSCSFSTCSGDRMSAHLMEKPQHCCIIMTQNELSVNGPETQKRQSAHSVTSPSGGGGGAFIPIHLLPSGQTFTQLSVKPLTAPSPLSSPPAMTIKFLGPRPPQLPISPLTSSQLPVVLSSLCHGVLQASHHHQTPPQVIASWMDQQRRWLSDRKWCWRTEKNQERNQEWLLSQREQQLSLEEAVLLEMARTALGEDSQLTDWYSWSVDFLLRHELSLQPTNKNNNNQKGRLPRSIRDNSRMFIQSLTTQIQSFPPHSVGFMDEFSIFIDLDLFSSQNPSAFQLSGSAEDEPVFDIVFSGLSNGTFMPPVLFFRGTPSPLPEGFPDNVLLEAQQEGFTDQQRLHIWIEQVWHPHVASQRNPDSVLMVDVHRGHLRDEFRGSLTSMSTEAVFIPSGCCCRLQPLDICMTPVLRDFLLARWTQLMSEGGLEGLGLDQLALTLACWLSEVSSTLNSATHFLRRSFASVFNLQQLEDQQEAAKMIAALTEALVHPLETSEPEPGSEPGPGPQLELLLVMEDEDRVDQDHQEVAVEEVDQDQKEDLEEDLWIRSLSALRQVFHDESDQDSFHGFPDD